MEQDEIYLLDIWRIFVREWKWFMALLVLTLIVALAFAHFAKRQWEATAWIQIAQVGQVPSGQDEKVEPLLRVIERLKMVPFENEIMHGLGFSPDSAEAQLYRKSLKLEPMPYAGPLIRLSVRAASPQQARQFAMATVTRLRSVHQSLEALPLQSARAHLEQIQADLQSAAAERDRLQQAIASANKNGSESRNTAGLFLADMQLASRNQEIRGLQQTRIDLVDRLGPTYTYETSMPWPVYVPRRQAFPNPVLALGIGVLLGIFLGALAAIGRNLARRLR